MCKYCVMHGASIVSVSMCTHNTFGSLVYYSHKCVCHIGKYMLIWLLTVCTLFIGMMLVEATIFKIQYVAHTAYAHGNTAVKTSILVLIWNGPHTMDHTMLSNGNAVVFQCTHLVSSMECLTWALCEGKWETVRAGSRLILKRSCSQANTSSARFIFLWVNWKSAPGLSSFRAASMFCATQHRLNASDTKLGMLVFAS